MRVCTTHIFCTGDGTKTKETQTYFSRVYYANTTFFAPAAIKVLQFLELIMHNVNQCL